jgi:probable HAF family extracellular repeat protein
VFEGLGARTDCEPSLAFRPTDVSGDGRVVVGTCKTNVPFRWTVNVGYETLGIRGTVNATNRDGSIVVGQTSDRPYRLNWNTRELTMLPGPGSGYANAISDDDRVVVGSIDNSNGKGVACRWIESGTPERLGILRGGLFSGASAVNRDGSVIAGTSDSDGMVFHAFRWTEANRSLLDLGTLGATEHSVANAMTLDGSLIVGEAFSPAYPGTEQTFLWSTSTGAFDIGTLDGYLGAFAVDVNADASLVAVQLYQLWDKEPLDRAAVWRPSGGLRRVSELVTEAGGNCSGWSLRGIVAVSAAGKVVVGYGVNPGGDFEPWIARF